MQGRVALVTGGTSGIGRFTAVALARAGADVVVAGRREPEGRDTVRQIEDAGGRGSFVRTDVAREPDVRAMIDHTVRTFGRLDYAVNNAGVELFQPLVEANPEDFRRIYDVNVLGVLLSMKHEVPAMLKTGGGSIVNISSVAATIGYPTFSIYGGSKAAVVQMTRVAAIELAKQSIRVNTVSPAVIQTDMYERFAGDEQSRAAVAAMHPIGRIGQPDEIAAAVLFLCSDGASFITGHELRVDGGLTVP